jgi:serine/threonine protein phosphatase 1
MIDRKIFAIGDIHGHAKELHELIKKLITLEHFQAGEDELVLLGDLVDTGEDTNEVLEWCLLQQQLFPATFHPLMGNHEHMLLDALVHKNVAYGDYYIWFNQGGRQTISSYLPKDIQDEYQRAIMQPLDFIPKEHIEFLQNLPPYWETEKYFFVHAGVRPNLSLEEQKKKRVPLEDNDSFLWIRSQFYASKFDWGKKIIFAHSPFEDPAHMDHETKKFIPYVQDNMIGINTLPRNEGKLTCVILPEEKFVFQEKL